MAQKCRSVMTVASGCRRIGKEVRIEEGVEVYGPYERRNRDGRFLKSISSTVYNAGGKGAGPPCLNLDVFAFEAENLLIKWRSHARYGFNMSIMRCSYTHGQLFIPKMSLFPLCQRDGYAVPSG